MMLWLKGGVKYQERSQIDAEKDLPNPAIPYGYYVLSRIYLQYDIPEYLGKEVSFIGKIGTIRNWGLSYPILSDITNLDKDEIKIEDMRMRAVIKLE